jgi:hypothetical protein
MTQEKLSGLTTIALESDILEKINYNVMTEDFILRNTCFLVDHEICLIFSAIFAILE